MNCARVRRLLSAYYDAELPAERRAAVRRHLQGCTDCRSQLDGFKNLADLTAQWTDVQPAASLWRQLAPKIRAACEAAAAEAIAALTEQNQKLPGARRTFKPALEGLEDRYALADLLCTSAAAVAPAAIAASVAVLRVVGDCSSSMGSAAAYAAAPNIDFGLACLFG